VSRICGAILVDFHGYLGVILVEFHGYLGVIFVVFYVFYTLSAKPREVGRQRDEGEVLRRERLLGLWHGNRLKFFDYLTLNAAQAIDK